MRHLYTIALTFTLVIIGYTSSIAQNVGISSTTITPDPQAILELRSTDKGVLLPRLTTAQAATLATSLVAADDGMTVYDTNLKRYKYWNGTTLTWNVLATNTSVASNTLDDAYDAGGAGAGSTIIADSGPVVITGTGGANALTTDGDVGFGTTSPNARLEVQEAAGGSPFPVRVTKESNSANELIGIGFGAQVGQHYSKSGVVHERESANGTGKLHFLVDDAVDGNDVTLAESRMTIDRDGLVGIGTTIPGYQLTLGAGGNVFGVENTATFLAKNSGGSYEAYLWPRWNDNVMYMNYGSGGMNLRNNASQTAMFIDNDRSIDIRKGVLFNCDDCGSTSTIDGASNWGDLVVQGRVMSTNSNLHLSPPAGFNVIINDTYRAAGGSNVGSAGLQVESLAGTGNRVIMADAAGLLYSSASLVGTGLGDNLGNHTATGTLNMANNLLQIKPDVTVNTGNTGIGWHGASDSYKIYQEAGAWTSPYPDLMIRFHTGIKLSAEGSYDGVNIYATNGEGHTARFNNDGQYLYQGWFRPHNNDGIYFQTHGGGLHMTDATWVRASHSKSIWTAQTSQADVQMNSPVFNFGQWNNGLPTFYDGQFYRTGGQAEMRFDDWFYMRDNDGNIRHQFNSDGGEILLGPNTGWGRYLRIGGNGNVTSEANIATTDGNLHLDSRAGSTMYLNYYNNTWVRAGNSGSTGYRMTGNFEYFDDDSWIYNRYAPNDRVYFENRLGVKGAIQIAGNPWGWADARCTGCNDAISGNPNLWLTAQDRVYLTARNTGEAYEFGMETPGVGNFDKGVVPQFGNYGLLGTPGRYWYITYSGHFRYKHFWDDYESFDTYDDIAELRAIEMDTVWDPILNHHVGKIRGETLPKFIMNYEDKEGAGEFIDVRRMDGFLLGASRQIDRETVERDERLTARTEVLASALGVDFSKPRTENITVPIKDMGSASGDSDKIEVTFNEAFASKVNSTPIISITPTAAHQSFYVSSKSKTGFTVKVARQGESSFSFDWTAMGETEVKTAVGDEVITNIEDVFYRKPIKVVGTDHPINDHKKRVDPAAIERSRLSDEEQMRRADEVSRQRIEQMNRDAVIPDYGDPMPENPAKTGDAAEADPAKRANPPSENDLGPGPPNGGPPNPNDVVGPDPTIDGTPRLPDPSLVNPKK